MIIDCVSDLHGHYPQLQGGDLLIVAGDLTARHTEEEFYQFARWIRRQDYDDIVVIAGNHDTWLQEATHRQIDSWIDKGGFEYLNDSATEVHLEGDKNVKIWGSPWTLRFPGINPRCMAFTCDTDEDLAEKWSKIPRNTDILVTHSPPGGWFDTTVSGKSAGSYTLLDWTANYKPRLHVFGHIHEAYGSERSFFGRRSFANGYGVTMVNASHVNERYEPINKPIRVVL